VYDVLQMTHVGLLQRIGGELVTAIIKKNYLLRQMAAHIKYTNQYTKTHTIHSIKGNYKLGLQFIHCYEKKSLCPQNVSISSALDQQHQSTSYEWNILTISCHTRVYT